jgi:CDGSH-type Zn-finger protein
MAENQSIVAQKGPYEKIIKAGERFLWCTCGRSNNQPVCDGSHKITDLRPKVMIAEKDETVWLCGCKQTKTPPYCDGTHETL